MTLLASKLPPPMPTLTYRLWIELRQALLDAYDRQGLSELLLFKFDFRLDNNFPNEGLEATDFKLVDKANRERWLIDLVAAAASSRPKNASLQNLLRDLNSTSASGSSQGDPQPNINKLAPRSDVSLESM